MRRCLVYNTTDDEGSNLLTSPSCTQRLVTGFTVIIEHAWLLTVNTIYHLNIRSGSCSTCSWWRFCACVSLPPVVMWGTHHCPLIQPGVLLFVVNNKVTQIQCRTGFIECRKAVPVKWNTNSRQIVDDSNVSWNVKAALLINFIQFSHIHCKKWCSSSNIWTFLNQDTFTGEEKCAAQTLQMIFVSEMTSIF